MRLLLQRIAQFLQALLDRPHPLALLPRLLFTDGEYVQQAADRDFFYLALKPEQ